MDDAACKIANDREALGFEHFAQMELVEFTQPVADFLQQGKRERRRMLDKGKHLAARQKINFGGLRGGSGGRTQAMLNDGHLTKNFGGAQPGKTRCKSFKWLSLAGDPLVDKSLRECNIAAFG